MLFIDPLPTEQASDIMFTILQPTWMSISWTNGNGSKRAVFVAEIGPYRADGDPVDSITYVADTVFGAGSQIGTSGWYCVYNGKGSGVTVTGLTPNTLYKVKVREYNGQAGGEHYNVSETNNNPYQTASVPLSDWAIWLSLLLIGGFVLFKYKRKFV